MVDSRRWTEFESSLRLCPFFAWASSSSSCRDSLVPLLGAGMLTRLGQEGVQKGTACFREHVQLEQTGHELLPTFP